MIVVDTNIVAYSLIRGPRTALALEARRRDPRWRFPELWRHEYLNVLATFARQTGLDAGAVTGLWNQAAGLLAESTVAVNMSHALQIAVEHGISAYDAQFLALAHQLGVPCVTDDKRLQRRFPGRAISMEEFCQRKAEAPT